MKVQGIELRNLLGSMFAVLLCLPGATLAQAVATKAVPTTHHYDLLLDGQALCTFAQVNGMTAGTVVKAQPVVGARAGEITNPVRTETQPIVLSRGSCPNPTPLKAWREALIQNKPNAFRTVTIVFFGPAGNTVARYQLTRAFPKEIREIKIGASPSSPLMLELELEYQSISRMR